jgi:glycosyltransferase involved in cell wall biosynthesis
VVGNISVVIPAFNRETTILRAVTSALEQGPSVSEVIVVDDASSDRTVDMLNQVQDCRLRVVSLPLNSGASAARNRGIDASISDVIAFLDADDEWCPGFAVSQIKALSDGHAVVCGFRTEGRRRRTVIPSDFDKHGSAAILLNRHSGFSTSCIAIHRNALATGLRFDTALPALQDLDFVLQLCMSGKVNINTDVMVRKFSGLSGRVYSGRNVFLARKKFIGKWGVQLAKTPGAASRQHRLLVLASTVFGHPADTDEAIKELRSLDQEEPLLRNRILLLCHCYLPFALKMLSRLANKLEDLWPQTYPGEVDKSMSSSPT